VLNHICVSDQQLFYVISRNNALYRIRNKFLFTIEKKWCRNVWTVQDFIYIYIYIHKSFLTIYSIKLNLWYALSWDRRNSFYRLPRNYARTELWYPFCGDRFGLNNESSPARNLICCNVNTFASRTDWISETITQCRWAMRTGHDGTWIECLSVTRELATIICERRIFAESKLIISLSSDFDGWTRKIYFHEQR